MYAAACIWFAANGTIYSVWFIAWMAFAISDFFMAFQDNVKNLVIWFRYSPQWNRVEICIAWRRRLDIVFNLQITTVISKEDNDCCPLL